MKSYLMKSAGVYGKKEILWFIKNIFNFIYFPCDDIRD